MVEAKRDDAVAQQKIFDFEFRIRRPQGEEGWVYCQGGALYDPTGRPTRIFGVNIDITERKRAEEALREAHEPAIWLARFPEQNPNPVIRASADGTILYCNPSTTKFPGWKCEVGQVLQNELLPLVGRAMGEGKEVQEDVKLARRVYIVWITPFPGEGYANVYGRDITERKVLQY